MFATTAEAKQAAFAAFQRSQCARGRHVIGCEHRPCSPWVKRALGHLLPVKDTTERTR